MCAKGVKDVPPERLSELNRGEAAISNLVEGLAMDQSILLSSCFPDIGEEAKARMKNAQGLGISQRMMLGGALMSRHLGPKGVVALIDHPSDTVRGWACFAIGGLACDMTELLRMIRPFAEDPHFGVREWAWLAVRPKLAADLDQAIALLSQWSRSPCERMRRFASEALRPRGVWCAHIAALKTSPEIALALLSPLAADPSRYVQDSVANWLNDASKTRPDWVRDLAADWLVANPSNDATLYIVRRALRSIKDKQ